MMGRRRFYDQMLDDARDTVQTTSLTEQDALTLKDFIHVCTHRFAAYLPLMELMFAVTYPIHIMTHMIW